MNGAGPLLAATLAVAWTPARQDPSPRPYVTFDVASVAGCGYLVLRGDRAAWRHARGAATDDWRVRREPGAVPSEHDRVVVGHAGPGRVRVVQQPRAANDWTTVLVVPEPEVSWSAGADTWRFPCEDGARREIELTLVPFETWSSDQLVPGQLEDEQREALRLEGRGELRRALDRYEAIALAAGSRELRARALERYADVHRDVPFLPTVADRAKVAELLDEQVRATYGDEGTIVCGKHVLLLWPRDFADHPSVPGFLARLDAAYAALIDLTGQDPNDVYGHRFVLFFMPQGAAWFDHHAGMGRDEFAEHPPFDTVWFHEMGHDFFKYPTAAIAPEPSWGEGAASFAQLRALDFLGFDPAGLLALWQEGRRQLAEHAARGGVRPPDGAYLAGAALMSELGARPAAHGITWDWDAYRDLCARFRGIELQPTSPADRYRHWAATLAGVFGTDAVYPRLSELGFPVARDDRDAVRVELEEVLPGLREARDELARGRPRAAERILEVLAERRDHLLQGEVHHAVLELRLAQGDREDAREAADRLGLVRAWWIHGPVAVPADEGADSFAAPIEALLGDAPVPREIEGRRVWCAERALGATPLEELRGSAGPFREHVTESADGRVDLRALLGTSGAEPTVGYAVTVLESESDTVVDLRLGRDDDAVVFLNGRVVERMSGMTGVHFDQFWVPLRLSRGANLLALKVVDRAGEWGFVARVTGRDGLAATGVQARLPSPGPPAAAGDAELVWSLGEADGTFRDLGDGGATDPWPELFPDGVDVSVARAGAAQAWSPVHPGPNDRWAGSRVHVFALRFELAAPLSDHELRVRTVGQNGWTPPLWVVSAGGEDVALRLPGSPDAVLRDPSQGTPCELRVRIPARLLLAGENRVDLSIPAGSWVLYDALSLWRVGRE